jgi:long-chain acyl-CoA synthetase
MTRYKGIMGTLFVNGNNVATGRAVIDPHPDTRLSADVVKSYLRDRIAGYKVPRLAEFQTNLPREDSGKIFKRKLRASYWEKAGRLI